VFEGGTQNGVKIRRFKSGEGPMQAKEKEIKNEAHVRVIMRQGRTGEVA